MIFYSFTNNLVLNSIVFNLSETVRQMLGLEEDEVVELSGDNAKYEVIHFKGKYRKKSRV